MFLNIFRKKTIRSLKKNSQFLLSSSFYPKIYDFEQNLDNDETSNLDIDDLIIENLDLEDEEKEKSNNKILEINSIYDFLKNQNVNLNEKINVKNMIDLKKKDSSHFLDKIKKDKNFHNIISKNKFLFTKNKDGVANLLDYIQFLVNKNNLSVNDKIFLKDFKNHCEFNFGLFEFKDQMKILRIFSNEDKWEMDFFFDNEIKIFFDFFIYDILTNKLIYKIFEILPELKNLKIKDLSIGIKVRNIILVYFEEKFDSEKFISLFNYFKSKKNDEVLLHLFHHLKLTFNNGKIFKIIIEKFKKKEKDFQMIELENLKITSILILARMYKTQNFYGFLVKKFGMINPKNKNNINFQIFKLTNEYLISLKMDYEDLNFYEYFENYLQKEIKEIKKLLKIEPENFILMNFKNIQRLKNFLELSFYWLKLFSKSYLIENELREILNTYLENKNFRNFLDLENINNRQKLNKIHKNLNLIQFEKFQSSKIMQNSESIFELNLSDLSILIKNKENYFLQKKIQDLIFGSFQSHIDNDLKIESIISFLSLKNINIEYFEIINKFLMDLNFDSIQFNNLLRIFRYAKPEIIERKTLLKIHKYLVLFGMEFDLDGRIWGLKIQYYDEYEMKIK